MVFWTTVKSKAIKKLCRDGYVASNNRRNLNKLAEGCAQQQGNEKLQEEDQGGCYSPNLTPECTVVRITKQRKADAFFKHHLNKLCSQTTEETCDAENDEERYSFEKSG